MKILIDEEVVQHVLEDLSTYAATGYWNTDHIDNVITALRSALDAAEKVEPSDWDINSMDAAVWAKAFAERFSVWSQAHGVESDTFGLMVGWFANAIMAGYDEATRRNPAPAGGVEPVAWYLENEDEFMTEKLRKEHECVNSYTFKLCKVAIPLYTHPAPAVPEETK